MSERTEADIEQEISALVAEIATLRGNTPSPFVTGWVLAYSIDSVELTQKGSERIEYVAPESQALVHSVGLYAVAERCYSTGW